MQKYLHLNKQYVFKKYVYKLKPRVIMGGEAALGVIVIP